MSADSTPEVLALHHEHGIRRALAVVDDLRRNLSTSVRLADVTEGLATSLARDPDVLPELDPRYLRLNFEEPYRPKLTCVHHKLSNTRTRVRA